MTKQEVIDILRALYQAGFPVYKFDGNWGSWLKSMYETLKKEHLDGTYVINSSKRILLRRDALVNAGVAPKERRITYYEELVPKLVEFVANNMRRIEKGRLPQKTPVRLQAARQNTAPTSSNLQTLKPQSNSPSSNFSSSTSSSTTPSKPKRMEKTLPELVVTAPRLAKKPKFNPSDLLQEENERIRTRESAPQSVTMELLDRDWAQMNANGPIIFNRNNTLTTTPNQSLYADHLSGRTLNLEDYEWRKKVLGFNSDNQVRTYQNNVINTGFMPHLQATGKLDDGTVLSMSNLSEGEIDPVTLRLIPKKRVTDPNNTSILKLWTEQHPNEPDPLARIFASNEWKNAVSEQDAFHNKQVLDEFNIENEKRRKFLELKYGPYKGVYSTK